MELRSPELRFRNAHSDELRKLTFRHFAIVETRAIKLHASFEHRKPVALGMPEVGSGQASAPAASARHPVYVIEGDQKARCELTSLLASFGYRTRAWNDGQSFLRAARSLAPACVLVRLDLPRLSGLQLQEELRKKNVALPLIFITDVADVPSAVQAMRGGALHFLERPIDPDQLYRAVGEAVDLLKDAMRSPERDWARRKIAYLTSREEEVLKGLCAGLPNKSIAFDLGLSPRTIEVHRASIMRKLDVRSLAQALRIAFEAGF